MLLIITVIMRRRRSGNDKRCNSRTWPLGGAGVHLTSPEMKTGQEADVGKKTQTYIIPPNVLLVKLLSVQHFSGSSRGL